MNWRIVALLIAIFFLIFSIVFPKALYSMGKEFIDKYSFTKISEEEQKLNEQQKDEVQRIACREYSTKAAVDKLYLIRADEECTELIQQLTDKTEKIIELNNLIKLYLDQKDKDERKDINIEKVIEKYEIMVSFADDELKKSTKFTLLELYYDQKNLNKAEQMANGLITDAKESKFSLFALYYLAKIAEERKQYQLAIDYYDNYITKYEQKLNEEKLTNIIIISNNDFIREHTIISIINEKELAAKQIE